MPTERILLIADETPERATLVRDLWDRGLHVGVATPATAAPAPTDVVVLDRSLADADGASLLRGLAGWPGSPAVVVIVPAGAQDAAAQAREHGATDVIHRPFDAETLAGRLRRALETAARGRSQPLGAARIIGRSAAIQRLREQARRIAQSSATTLLIRGESGVGKGVLARAIHDESARAGRSFISFSCTALPEDQLEAELFGDARGAARAGALERAHGGTICLDDVGDLPASLQAKLVRFLDERRVRRIGGSSEVAIDTLLIAGTHRDLDDSVRRGTFRADLYYRLKVIAIDVPPLRERPEDVALLAQAFVDELRVERGTRASGLSHEALRLLGIYQWPGNARELKNAIERAAILSGALEIQPGDLPAEIQSGRSIPARALSTESIVTLPQNGVRLEAVEQDLVRQAIGRTAGNQSAAARLLGLTRDQLRYRMERMGLLPPPPRRRLRSVGAGKL